jgi:hypothetical protein
MMGMGAWKTGAAMGGAGGVDDLEQKRINEFGEARKLGT